MKLTLVKKNNEAKNTKSFFLKADIDFNWKPGQYLVLKLAKLERQFTICSSPTEGQLLQITVRLREKSDFKSLLNKLKVGAIVEASGPFGMFVLEKDNKLKNNIFLAGGIGITPFRSMIKYNVDNDLRIPMSLIYSNSDSQFIFKKDLENWKRKCDYIKTVYFNSSDSGHLDYLKLLNLISELDITDTIFWVVGPKTFVNAIEDNLHKLNIPLENIKSEKFIGY